MNPRVRQILDRVRSRTAAFVHDLLVVPIAWMAAYWVRFNLGEIPDFYLSTAISSLPAVMVVQGIVFWYFGLYRGVWRFASVPDLVRILRAVVVGVALTALAVFLLTRMQGVPRSVLPLFGVLLVVMLGSPRLLYRWVKDRRLYYPPGQKALIVGAGEAGETLARDLLRDPERGFVPVGYVDDDNAKKGREIHGIRVLGGCEKIPPLARRMDLDLVLIALPSANAAQMRRIVGLCDEAGIAARTLPALQDLVSGRSAVRDLREVSIDDLLGRDPVALDWERIAANIAGSTVLVSGGGGSIGSELCRQIARLGPKRLVVMDASEFNLYTIEQELRHSHPQIDVRPALANVAHAAAVDRVFEAHSPDLVFHAAAYKHVPMLEHHAVEAVRNNLLGTRLMAEAAGNSGVRGFVLISTDKAVNPTNIMGATKRLAEAVCQMTGSRHRDTAFITVRFGNVLDSAGSVVPLFRRQIDAGGPVTVTHREVTRYFMTIPEACQLILEAGAVGQGGEIFVLDMGDPVNITYLAEQMIRLAGKTPGDDIEIRYIGLRPGEKMTEELFLSEEDRFATDHEKLLLARGMPVDLPDFLTRLEHLFELCDRYDEDVLRGEVMEMVRVLSGRSDSVTGRIVSIDAAKGRP